MKKALSPDKISNFSVASVSAPDDAHVVIMSNYYPPIAERLSTKLRQVIIGTIK
jgi:hypothetical protein